MSLIVTLDERSARFVDEQVRSGEFGDAAEVLRAGLKLLSERQRQEAELKRLIEAGYSSGPAKKLDWVELRAEARRRLSTADVREPNGR